MEQDLCQDRRSYPHTDTFVFYIDTLFSWVFLFKMASDFNHYKSVSDEFFFGFYMKWEKLCGLVFFVCFGFKSQLHGERPEAQRFYSSDSQTQ